MIGRQTLAWIAVLSLGLIGCSESQPTGEAGGAQASANQAAQPDSSSPAGAVHVFLESVRLGDDAKAGGMLTLLAQQKTAELDMVVAPPGSDTASFKIGETALDGKGSAHVASAWTDMNHEGQKRTDQITWILKEEKTGWRIAGMATRLAPGQAPVILNFENPAEMLEKQRLAEERAYQQAEEQKLQARAPEDPFQSKKQR